MNGALLVALVLVAGGIGAALRFVLDGLIRSQVATRVPLGTAVINLSGSLLLGLATGLTAGHLLPHPVHLIVGTGFLGGYTTFSTASFETVRLLEERRPLAAVVYGFGLLVVCTAAAAAGLAVGLAVVG